jgi:hypothetical protein
MILGNDRKIISSGFNLEIIFGIAHIDLLGFSINSVCPPPPTYFAIDPISQILDRLREQKNNIAITIQ